MTLELNRIYIITLYNGKKFCAMCTEIDGDWVEFASKGGIQSRHPVEDIIMAIPVVH